jgi:hypothetical protein
VWPKILNKQFEKQWNSRILAVQDVTVLQGEWFELFEGNALILKGKVHCKLSRHLDP